MVQCLYTYCAKFLYGKPFAVFKSVILYVEKENNMKPDAASACITIWINRERINRAYKGTYIEGPEGGTNYDTTLCIRNY